MVHSTCTCHFHTLQFKTQMQVEILRAKTGGTPQYRNVFHAGYVIASRHGVRGVYQGLGATWQRNAPAVGIYFGKHTGGPLNEGLRLRV